MADTPLVKLEEQFLCSVCLDQYKEPKILPCHHSFCRECLGQTPQELEQGKYILKCPICREPVQLTDGGVPSLPPSFFINNLMDVYQGLQKVESSNSWPCPDHNKPLDLYCNNCDTVICDFCATHEHRGHICDLSAEVYDSCMEPVCELLATMESEVDEIDRASCALNEAMTRIVAQGEETKRQVNEAADEMILKINQSRQQLLGQVEQAVGKKGEMIQLQIEKSNSIRKELTSAGNSVRQVLQEKSKHKILASKNEIIRLKLTNSRVDMRAVRPTERADLIFKKKGDADLGEVQVSLWCEKFEIIGTGPFWAQCGRDSNFEIKINQLDDENEIPPVAYLTCTTVPETNVTLTREGNKCTISYIPTVCGKLKLTFLIGSTEVKSSAVTITVLPSFKQSFVIEGFNEPLGIAVSKGTIAVAEGGSQKVTLLTNSGGRHSIDCPRPYGIAFTNDQHLLAADNLEGCIKKFTLQGEVVKKYSPDGGMYSGMVRLLAKTSVFDNLLGIALSKDGIVAFVEKRTETVQLLNPDLSYQGCFGGGLLPPFGHPTDVAFDSCGNIYVSSSWDNVVMKFNKHHTKLAEFGKPGHQEGQLQCPSAIAICEDDTVYVTEKENHRISIFDSDGQFLTCFGQKGSGEGELNSPCGIAIDKSGKLYVSDTGNNRVVVYQ